MNEARLLGPDDVTLWRDLRTEGLRLFPEAFLPSPDEIAGVSEEQDARMLAQGGRFGVFDGDTPLGIAALRREFFERARHRASIGPFYVTPDAHGSSAASTLMQAMVDHASDNGVWQIELCVAEANPRAIAFYERCGFRREGRWPNSIITETGPKHDLFYVRDLRST